MIDVVVFEFGQHSGEGILVFVLNDRTRREKLLCHRGTGSFSTSADPKSSSSRSPSVTAPESTDARIFPTPNNSIRWLRYDAGPIREARQVAICGTSSPPAAAPSIICSASSTV